MRAQKVLVAVGTLLICCVVRSSGQLGTDIGIESEKDQSIEEQSNELREYNEWKEKKEEELKGKDLLAQEIELIGIVKYYLSKLKENPDSIYDQKEALFSYKYLREKMQLSPTVSLEDINQSWLDQEDYRVWKELKLERWSKTPLFQQLAELADLVTKALAQPDIENPNEALFPYNFLREILRLPTISSVGEIDKVWLEQIIPELELFTVIEELDGELPTQAQRELVLEAARLLKFEQEIEAVQHPVFKGGSSGGILTRDERIKHYVALCRTPDIDTRLYVLYHELGHIVHDAGKIHLVRSNQSDPVAIIDETDFKSDLKDIRKYFEIGLSKVPSLSNTKVGKDLAKALAMPEAKKVLEEYGMLWIPPEDVQEKQKMIYLRGTEQRADLFAFRQLLKLQRISGILSFIGDYGRVEECYHPYYVIVKGNEDVHPSNVERALYAIGFLIDHGFDVPSILEKWEKQGVCVSGEQATSYAKLFTMDWDPVTRGKIEAAYRAWKKEKEPEEYNEWKEKKQEELKGKDPLDQKANLMGLVRFWLFRLEEDPDSAYGRKKALFHYNYLREKMGLPVVSSWKSIDQKWLDKEEQTIWKEGKQVKWRERNLSEIGQEADLIRDAKYYLSRLKEDPGNIWDQKAALLSYNYLMEKMDMPVVSSWKSIDQRWLDKEDYTVWKEQKQVEWRERNLSEIDQEADLIKAAKLWLFRLEEDPGNIYDQKLALFNYNYLREKKGLPVVSSWKSIDQRWLDKEYYTVWKEEKQVEWRRREKWEGREIGKIDQEVELIGLVKFRLSRLKEDPGNIWDQESALFNYNYLREKKGLPIVSSWKNIDQRWLNSEEYTIWEEQKQIEWGGYFDWMGQKAGLLGIVKYHLARLEEDPGNIWDQKAALLSYNYLMEKMDMPTVSSLESINQELLKKLEEAIVDK